MEYRFSLETNVFYQQLPFDSTYSSTIIMRLVSRKKNKHFLWLVQYAVFMLLWAVIVLIPTKETFKYLLHYSLLHFLIMIVIIMSPKMYKAPFKVWKMGIELDFRKYEDKTER